MMPLLYLWMMSKKKRSQQTSGDKVPPREGKQAEILAETSDDESADGDLARGRQPRPEDAGKVKQTMKSKPKKSTDK